ncbi:7358_t:CDS:1 [Paraglomus occultum]|uniref:7358_t:CDS:1 n=1 Tax=Paraglomus occultum TaxID=144539 RepID=A0A9N9G7W1_9GLOM|nr:7358_t:CDS:1 [Paraglomus occultum]
MSDSTSPLLAATHPQEDVSHVLFNTSLPTSNTAPHTTPISPASSFHSTYSSSPTSSSLTSPFYKHPRLVSFIKGFALYFFFPFLSGMMMGFGEISANELAFRLGWFGTRNVPLIARNVVPLGPQARSGAGLKPRRGGENASDANGNDRKGEMVYAEMSPLA